MEPDRQSGWDDETREAVGAFRAAIEAAAPAEGRERLRAALAGERRRSRGGGLGLLLRVAAVVALGLGGVLVWRFSASAGDAVVCPHGTAVVEEDESLPQTLRAFLENPDNFQRVCQCQPRFSGNLRNGAGSF